MKRTYCMLALLGLMLMPWSISAQTQAAAPEAAAQPAQTAIPPDQQATRAQLDKLFEVMQLRKQMQMVMKMMPVIIQRQMHEQMKDLIAKLPDGNHITPEQQAGVEEIMNKYMEKELNIYSMDVMLNDMATVYQRHFTRADVDAYIAFYSTPAGQHLLEEQPEIMREYMPMVMERVQKSSEQLSIDMMKEMEDYIHSTAKASQSAPQSSAQPASK